MLEAYAALTDYSEDDGRRTKMLIRSIIGALGFALAAGCAGDFDGPTMAQWQVQKAACDAAKMDGVKAMFGRPSLWGPCVFEANLMNIPVEGEVRGYDIEAIGGARLFLIYDGDRLLEVLPGLHGDHW